MPMVQNVSGILLCNEFPKAIRTGFYYFVYSWLTVWVGVVLGRSVVGCDPGESMFVVG